MCATAQPLGSVGYENQVNEKGERLIWLAPRVVDRLRFLRGPGESYGDVILRLAAERRSNQSNNRDCRCPPLHFAALPTAKTFQ